MPIAWELFTEHPGFDLKPRTVWNIFTCAETGYPQQQVDMFEDLLENDGHLRGLFMARSNAVAGKSFVVQPGEATTQGVECALALEESLRGGEANFQEMLEHQLDSSPYGYAGSEIKWEYQGGMFEPAWFRNVAHRRWVFDKFGTLRVLTSAMDREGEEPTRGNWIMSRLRHTNPARAALMRTATWFAMFKRFAIRDWVTKAEKFGIPAALGFYQEGALPASLDKLDKALKAVGKGGSAMLSDMTRIEFADLKTNAGGNGMQSLHPSIIAMCEAQMSKLICGSTLTSDTGGPGQGGSYALGNVHAGVRFDIVLWSSMHLSRSLQSGLCLPFSRFNGFTCKPPQIKSQVVQETSQSVRAVVFKAAQEMGFPITEEQLAEELSLRAGGTTLSPVNKPVNDEGNDDEGGDRAAA